MYIKMLIFADSLFVESVTVKFRKYGEISVGDFYKLNP